MNKGKLKKFLASSAMGIMALTLPFTLTGCDKDSDINVRVNGEYIQWQVDGEDSWTNLISVDEIKDLLGETYKGDAGEQGNPGINGKEVEFRRTTTHIEWRYADSKQAENENWKKLIDLESLKVKGDTGSTGPQGAPGEKGDAGEIPYIGNNGNWWIGKSDTGVKAEGEQGNPGDDGREVEFQSTDTHIQWRYKTSDNSDEWKNLVALDEIKGNDAIVAEYTIKYDYNFTNADMSGLFDNYVDKHIVKSGEWIINMPELSVPNALEYFDGWYIKNTNKKIENFDLIGGDVELVARWRKDFVVDEENVQLDDIVFSYNADLDGYCAKLNTMNEIIYVPDTYNDNTNGVKDVVSISANSRSTKEVQALKSIRLPSGLLEISDYTFNRCENLRGIFLPNKIKNIGIGAFQNCLMLKNIAFEQNSVLESVGDYAFSNCSSLENVAIPNTVKTFGTSTVSGIFKGCSKLSSITIPYVGYNGTDNHYNSLGSLFSTSKFNGSSQITANYNDGGRKIIGYFFIPTTLKNVNVTGTTLRPGAFSGCNMIESVTLSGDIKTIPDNAFYNCESLKRVEFSRGVTTIGNSAFSDCDQLSYISTPDYIENLGEFVFNRCYKLETLVLKGSFTTIKSGVFWGCTSLKSVTLPSTIISIGTSAFAYCYELNTIILPSGVRFTGGSLLFCDKIEQIFCLDNEWAFTGEEDELSNASVYLYIENQQDVPNNGGKYWHFKDDGVTPLVWPVVE